MQLRVRRLCGAELMLEISPTFNSEQSATVSEGKPLALAWSCYIYFQERRDQSTHSDIFSPCFRTSPGWNPTIFVLSLKTAMRSSPSFTERSSKSSSKCFCQTPRRLSCLPVSCCLTGLLCPLRLYSFTFFHLVPLGLLFCPSEKGPWASHSTLISSSSPVLPLLLPPFPSTPLCSNVHNLEG